VLELELVQRLGLSGFILELLPQREDRELPLSLLPQRLLLLLPLVSASVSLPQEGVLPRNFPLR